MSKVKNIERVAKGLGLQWDSLSDGSGTWISLENDTTSIVLNFCGKGEKFESVTVSKKIWQVVDEEIIASVKVKSGNCC